MYLMIFFSSLITAVVLILLLRFLRLKLLGQDNVPLLGGAGIAISFFAVGLAVLVSKNLISTKVSGILISSALMFLFGLIDDIRELPVGMKFLLQVLVSCLLILFGVRCRIVYIGAILNILITILWVIGITNGFNHLDITDGLSGGSALLAALGFFMVALMNTDSSSAIMSVCLGGAALGFIFYNLPPAKVYLGNSGSHFLGFLLAAISLNISYASLERKTALLSPVLILGFPVFDTFFLALMRLKKKIIPIYKSNDHLVLRFLKLGYSRTQALLVMLTISFSYVLSGILLSQLKATAGIFICATVVLLSALLGYFMSRVQIEG